MLTFDTSPLRRRHRAGSLAIVALVVALVGALGIVTAARRTITGLEHVSGVAEVLSPSSDVVDNYLLVGSDSRSAGDPNTGDSGEVTGNRSDSLMVLRYDRSTGVAELLSLPRDLYVEVPGREGRRRINSAYNDGPDVLVRTVQMLGIPVHHYVEVDFAGFTELVEALGGIEICFKRPTRDANTGLAIPTKGCYTLDGKMALAYARSRHYEEWREGEWQEDPSSDIGRTQRQRRFVNLCLKKAVAEVKGNPFRTGSLVDAISAAVRTDAALDPLDAAMSLRGAVDEGLGTFALPVIPATVDGNDILELGDGAEAVLAYFRGEGPRPRPQG